MWEEQKAKEVLGRNGRGETSVEDERQLVGLGAKLGQMFCFSGTATPHLGGDTVCSMAVVSGAKRWPGWKSSVG